MKVWKPRFLNPNSAALPASQHWRIPWDILSLALVFICITLLAATLYYYGTPYGWGIQPTFQTTEAKTPAGFPVSFADCMHFSVVTIATLGYGDYRPLSYGRLVAALEVVAGIVLMGVLIARLVSRQQERLTKRLVGGQLNGEIQDFREMIAALLTEYKQRFEQSAAAGAGAIISDNDALLNKTAGLAKSLARYWRHEARQPDLANVVPVRAAGRMFGEVIAILECVANLVASKTPKSIGEENRSHVRNITESSLVIADVLEKTIEDTGIKHSAEKIYELISRLRSQLKLKTLWIKQ